MSEPQQKPTPARRARSHRRWRLVAIGSIAINLFLAGIFAGGLLRKGHRDDLPRSERAFSMRGAERTLGPDVRAIVDEVRGAQEAERTPRVERLRGAAQEANAALEAEPFDPKRLEQALAELRSAHAALQEGFHGEFQELAAKLTPAQRAALAKANARFGQRERRGGPAVGKPRRPR